MVNLVICAVVFSSIFLSGGVIASPLLIQEADALQAKGVPTAVTNSNKVCGDKLCSEVKAEKNKAQTMIANPSATYCIERGGEYDLAGTCTIPSVITCDAWDYFKTKTCDHQTSLLFVQTAVSGTYQEKDGFKTLNKAPAPYNLLISNNGRSGEDTIIDISLKGIN